MPRALWYHLYPGMWEVFFRSLGLSVVVSAKTDRATVERAALISEPEHCLPLKLHDAHLHGVVGAADVVFIPRVLSTLTEHIACPKLGSLPDCAVAQFGDETPILTIDIDENKRSVHRSMLELGSELGFRRNATRAAAAAALSAMKTERNGLKTCIDREDDYFLILAHPYILHDAYVSAPVFGKLDAMNVKWLFPDYGCESIESGPIKWDACGIMHDALLRLDAGRCVGVIHLSAFNCGCDSIVMEVFRGLLGKKNIPYMTLVIDEHEGRAGLDTRLEAFVDSIGWRNTIDNAV